MITILLFAQLQEDVGQSQLELDVGPVTVNGLKKILLDKYDSLQLDQAMISINEKYAKNDDEINPGDTVAVIPPISGG